ncbi:MAG: YbaB/EbfC family nucleoid-associated protein [Chlamydiota bacterium]|nr:YbaB/EbfC family nucleoid-associated protein [Chlamydiota bacterium]
MAGLNKFMKEAMKMQDKIKELRAEGDSGGGAVKVVLSGDRNLVSIKIDPSAISSGEVELLEDLILAAYQQAMGNLEQIYSKEVSKSMPGLPGLGF